MISASARLPLRLLAMLALALVLASCQYVNDVLPTISAPVEDDQPTVAPLDESPRLRNRQDVPPTWTPPSNQQSQTPVAPAEVVPTASGQASYTVQAGDTLAAIAQRYNVSIDELALANNIENYDHIEIGQVLVIPGF